MRPASLLACLAAAAILGPSAAAVEIDASQLFSQLDTNADGALSREEAGAPRARLFDRLVRTGDGDGNGLLDAEEFAAGLTPLRAEKALVEKQGSRVPGADALVVVLAKMDADGDRRLESSEIPAPFRDAFDQMIPRFDADKNGRLDAREIAQAGPQLGMIAQRAALRLGLNIESELAQLPPERRQAMEQMDAYPRPREMLADPEQAAELFERLDANGDKLLTAEEAPEGLANLLQRGDRDGDGKLSAQEFQQMSRRFSAEPAADNPAAARRNLRQLLNRFDRDRDGRLSRDEAPPRLAGNFQRLDRDSDGFLNRQELQNAAGPGRGQDRRPDAAEEMQQ